MFPLTIALNAAYLHFKKEAAVTKQTSVSSLSQVGLFRKSGVKSRIQALRQQCELTPDSVSYEDQSAYDVADMVKQFFRDLPEPLLTSKLGETFLHIYQCKSPRSHDFCNGRLPQRMMMTANFFK